MDALFAYLPDLLLVYSAFAVAVASPGPSNLAIMGTSMELGRLAGLALALGVTAGSLTWGILASIGVSALFAAHAGAITAIKIAGGLYFLYLGWRSARSAMTPDSAVAAGPSRDRQSSLRAFVRGYLMHLVNPKAILNWTAIIALGLPLDAPIEVVFAILGGCALISLTCNCGYATLFSSASAVRGYRKIRRWAEGLLALVFGLAGVKLLAAEL